MPHIQNKGATEALLRALAGMPTDAVWAHFRMPVGTTFGSAERGNRRRQDGVSHPENSCDDGSCCETYSGAIAAVKHAVLAIKDPRCVPWVHFHAKNIQVKTYFAQVYSRPEGQQGVGA